MSRFVEEFCSEKGSCTNKSCKQRALAAKPAKDDIAYYDAIICSKFKSEEGVVDKTKEIHLIGLWKGRDAQVNTNMADEPEQVQDEVVEGAENEF